MENKYRIKTRNWNGSYIAYYILKPWACDDDDAKDRDIKYYIVTSNPVRAWLTWALWFALRRLTGGWTYIVKPGHCLDGEYKSIY